MPGILYQYYIHNSGFSLKAGSGEHGAVPGPSNKADNKGTKRAVFKS